jgi:hypothetical protein
LEVAGAVQTRGQPEVALEKRTGFSEQIEEFVACWHGKARGPWASVKNGPSIQFALNRTAPPDVYLTD